MVSAKYVIVFIMVSETVNKTDSKQFFSISIKIDFKLTVETEYVIGTGRIVMGRFVFVVVLNVCVSTRGFRDITA